MKDEFIHEHLIESEGRSFIDDSIKRLLSHKALLALILQTLVTELKEYSLEEIISFMGDVKVSLKEGVVINPLITQGNSESKTKKGGAVLFDITFDLKFPTYSKIGFVINIEAQRDSKDLLMILTRAIYYCGRMVSEQKGRIFIGQEYKKMAKVYSIWIMRCYNERESSINIVRLKEEETEFVHKELECCYDYINIALVKLGREYKNSNKLLDLLGRLLAEDNNIEDKFDAWKENLELDAREDAKAAKEMRDMCNWSEGVIEHLEEKIREEVTQKVTEEVTEKVTEEITEKITEEVKKEQAKEFALRLLARDTYSYDEIADISGYPKECVYMLAKEK